MKNKKDLNIDNIEKVEKIKTIIDFYILNKKINICVYCNLLIHIYIVPEKNICYHNFILCEPNNPKNIYLIDSDFLKLIINNLKKIDDILNLKTLK